MKLSLFAACFFAAVASFAGVTYDFRSETTGLQQVTVDGTVAVEGPNLRMSMFHGYAMVFQNGSIILSRDGGKTLSVFDPETHTYFEITLDEVTASIAGVLKNSAVNVTFDNPVVNVKDAGDGGTLEGFPTKKTLLEATIDIHIDAMGQTLTSKMSMHNESWTTDKVPANAVNVFQQRSVVTGIDALDKLIAAQSASLKGRFPLKQVTTVHLIQNGRDLATTTTATVSNIKQKAIDASVFAQPEGYSRVDNPLKGMKKLPR
jgi:hypothetical protein